MHHTFLPTHLAVLGLGTAELVILMTLSLFPLMIIAIVATALYFKHRQRQEWHELVRLALEKGLPLPPHPGARRPDPDAESPMNPAGDHPPFRRRSRQHEIRAAFVLIAVGAAVFLGIPSTPGGRGFLVLAYIPAFVGVALLLNALFETVFSRKNARSDVELPRS
jgi:hypothetical protein